MKKPRRPIFTKKRIGHKVHQAVIDFHQEPKPVKVGKLKTMKARLSLYLYEHWGIK